MAVGGTSTGEGIGGVNRRQRLKGAAAAGVGAAVCGRSDDHLDRRDASLRSDVYRWHAELAGRMAQHVMRLHDAVA